MDWPRHLRAGVLTLHGNQAAAAAEYRHALEADPTDPPALIAVLQDCRARGDTAEAIAVAERALAQDESNFIALDGLAWGYSEQGDHPQAAPAVQRAIRALDGLDTRAAFRGFPRIMIGVLRLFMRLPGLRRHFPRLRTTAEMEAQAAHGIAEWRTWASDYLAWYDREYGSGPTQAHQ